MNTARKVFLALFALSTLGMLVLFLSLQPSIGLPTPSLTQDPSVVPTPSPNNPGVDPSSQNANDMGVTALIGSVITSVTSLVGFITTTVITWRKEKREASLADVERKKLETELEKSRLELEKLKQGKKKNKTKK